MYQANTETSVLDRVVSWLSLLLLTFVATAFSWYVPYQRESTKRIFEDFKLKLPPATQFAFSVPTSAVIGVSIAAIVGALTIQLSARSKRSASIAHLLLVFTYGLVFLAYREAMGTALFTLIDGITAPARSR